MIKDKIAHGCETGMARSFSAVPVLAAALFCIPAGAPAQEYPSRPIRMIVPVSAGGGADAIARVISKDLQKSLGQPVVVDNRPGANTNIGTQRVASAAADGYTLLLTYSLVVVQPSLRRKLPYDLVRDLAPVIKLMEAPSLVAARAELPVSNVKDFVALARKAPGKITYGESGTGGPSHLAAELFNSLAEVNMLRVSYKGSAQTLIDLSGGHVDVSFATVVSTLPLIRAGRVKALAITSPKRSPILPDLPTVAESGVKGYEYVTWYGVFTRAGVPVPIIARLHRDIRAIITTSEVSQQFEREGARVAASTPAEFSEYIKSELVKWARVVKQARIPVEDD